MRYKKIIIVAGTRPNFVKAAPLLRAFKALPKANRPKVLLLHTGQHYDHLMSKIFFQDLEIPRPDIFLNVKSRTPAGQTDEIIAKFQKVLAVQKPDLVVVVGDVTGTMACALAAKMSGVKVAHVEAGLRSYDQSMPEERNRVLTDHVSDLLFTSCPEARGNLLKEGIAGRKIRFAGNVMIDTLKTALRQAQGTKTDLRQGFGTASINSAQRLSPAAQGTKTDLRQGFGTASINSAQRLSPAAQGTKTDLRQGFGTSTGSVQRKLSPAAQPGGSGHKGRKILSRLGLQKGDEVSPYVLLTLHRPGNVDDPKVLGPILTAFEKIAKEVTVVFPAHPRTLKYLKAYNLAGKLKNGKSEIGNGKSGLKIVPPLGYLDFIAMQQNALCVFTDSGGVQEETCFLNVPCFTVRNNTERPVTVSLGTNQIIGTKPGAILKAWGKFKRQPFDRASALRQAQCNANSARRTSAGSVWQLRASKIGNGKIGKPKADSLKRRVSIPRWDGHAAERIVETIAGEQ